MENEKPNILVIDDEPFFCNLLKNLLQDRCRVLAVNSGAEGLELAKGEPRPNLILLDVVMPEMDGYRVCQLLNENEATADIPVIFLTVKNEVEDEVRGFELGAVDYITKPISPPIVRSRVHTHLALAQARQALIDQKMTEIELEKLKIHRAMANAANHIINDFLNNMMLFKLKAEQSNGFPPGTIRRFEEAIDETTTQLRALGKVIDINERSILESVESIK